MRSYEKFAGADVGIDGVPGCELLPLSPASPEPSLQGWWTGSEHVSVPVTVAWTLAADIRANHSDERLALPPGCALELDKTYNLVITLRSSDAAPGADKFKLLRIASCGIFVYDAEKDPDAVEGAT